MAIGCVKDRTFKVNPYVTPGTPTLSTRSIIHYWNFNGSSLLVPTQTTGGSGLYYTGGGVYDAVNPGTTINARNGDNSGSGFRLRNPAGIFTLNLPTTNYSDIRFSFATQRSSSSGAQNNIIAYTIDGTNYITDSLQPNTVQLDTAWQSYFFDFSAIKRTDDNPNFKIQIRYAVSDSGISGNN